MQASRIQAGATTRSGAGAGARVAARAPCSRGRVRAFVAASSSAQQQLQTQQLQQQQAQQQQQQSSRRAALLSAAAALAALPASQLLPAPASAAAEAAAAAGAGLKRFEDKILAYSFLYPTATASGAPLSLVLTRPPEKYSSAAPLSADARQRIVSELFDLRR